MLQPTYSQDESSLGLQYQAILLGHHGNPFQITSLAISFVFHLHLGTFAGFINRVSNWPLKNGKDATNVPPIPV